jgi:hypothetical protein
MYVQRNIQAHSYNHCCSGKAMSITYSEFVFLALVIRHAMGTHHIVIIKGTILEKTLQNKTCVF